MSSFGHSLFCSLWPCELVCWILFPPGLNLCPTQWKHGVWTTGLLGRAQLCFGHSWSQESPCLHVRVECPPHSVESQGHVVKILPDSESGVPELRPGTQFVFISPLGFIFSPVGPYFQLTWIWTLGFCTQIWFEFARNVGDLCSIPRSGRFSGEGNGYPL